MTSVLKVNQIQDIGGNTIVSSDGTGGFTNNLPAGKSGAYRNIIINGDMSIAQRGTSFTGLGNGNNATYTLDRFAFNEGGSPTGECTISQDTDVPSGQGFANSLKVDVTTEETTVDASDLLYMSTTFEGQNLQYLKYGTSSAEKLTLSFWVKSNVTTGTFAVGLYNQDPSTTRVVNLTYTINTADTWEKKTFTIDGETVSGNGFDNDNNRSLWLYWIFTAGTDWTSGTQSDSWQDYATTKWAPGHTANLFSSTSNYINITGVQLEAGTTASDFEFLPYDVNLNRCLRYYEVIAEGNTKDIGYGATYATNTLGLIVTYSYKRTPPSLDIVSGTSYYRFYTGVNNLIDDFSASAPTNTRVLFYNNTDLTVADNVAGWVATNNAGAYIALDAEL